MNYENTIDRHRLHVELEIALGKRLSTTTVWRWLNELAIGCKRRYTKAEYEAMLRFGQLLKEDRSYKFVVDRISYEQRNNDQSPATASHGHFNEPIECIAREC